MKKFLVLLCLFCISTRVYAESFESDQPNDMAHFWEHNGRYEQKVLDVSSKLINANKLDKRVAVYVKREQKIINANAHYMDKSVYIYTGILPYFDNDDELASVIGHEIAHCLDYYDGPLKLISMQLNSKEYESKADLVGIDMMVKAGYNPIAAICAMNKISGESVWDSWFLTSHPKGSFRLVNMYKYIYRKYPSFLNSEMVHNVNFENFMYASQKEINEFKQQEKIRSNKRIENL